MGAQRHHGAGQGALEQADDTGVGDTGAHLVEAQCAQVVGDYTGGAEFAVAEFRVFVQVAPPSDDGGFNSRSGQVDGGGERAGVDGSGHHGSCG